MGTAQQSISNNPNDIQRQEFEKTLKEAIEDSFDREIQLGNVFRAIVNDILFNEPQLAGVRPTLTNKINAKVTAEITNKLKTWIAGGKKPEDWPFKNVPLRGEFPPNP